MKRGLAFASFGALVNLVGASVLPGCGCGGSSCAANSDCESGEVCVAEICVTGAMLDPDAGFPPFDNTQVGCSSDDQCGPCEFCKDGCKCCPDQSVQGGYSPCTAGGGCCSPTGDGCAAGVTAC